MISPELPCVYGGFFHDANATGQQLYLDSWRSYIASLRNHPSIFDWPLCNEMYMGDTFKVDGQEFGARKFWEIKQGDFRPRSSVWSQSRQAAPKVHLLPPHASDPSVTVC
jgi:hypothetical protein